MTTPIWPPAPFPAPKGLPVSVTWEDKRILTEMAGGPVKSRPSVSKPGEIITCELHLTGSQLVSWNAFLATIGYGASEFDVRHPILSDSTTTVIVRARLERLPEFTCVAGNKEAAKCRYVGTIRLLTVPWSEEEEEE
jgi:hypothetical protein